MKAYKKYILSLLTLTCTVCVAVGTANYIFDPFQVYRFSILNKGHYIQDQDRFQNAGVLNRLWVEGNCCDSIMLGTSHSQNFDADKVSNILKPHTFLNLAMAGAKPPEELKLLNTALKTKQPKLVLWELHIPFTMADMDIKPDGKLAAGERLPDYLYDGSIFNDTPYIFSLDTFKLIRKQAGSSLDLAHHKQWYDRNLSSFGKGKEIFAKNASLTAKNKLDDIPTNISFLSIDTILDTAVKVHPDIDFVFYFPPYSTHYYAHMSKENFDRVVAFRYALVKDMTQYRNVRIYMFDDMIAETSDLNNYKDMGHFHPDIGYKAMGLIAADKGRIDVKNIHSRMSAFWTKIEKYRTQNQ